MRFFSRQTLKVKILAGYLLLLILLLIPSALLCGETMDKTLQFNVTYMNQMNGQLNLNLDTMLSAFDRMNYLHYSDGELRNILTTNSERKSNAAKFSNDRYVRNTLNHAFRTNPFALRGAIITKYGEVFSSISDESKATHHYVNQWLEQVIWADQNQMAFTPVHQAKIQMANYRVVTVLQRLYYYDAYVGVLAIDLNLEEMGRRFDRSYTESFASSYCVLAQGETLYHSKNAYLNQEKLEESGELKKLWEDAGTIAKEGVPSEKIVLEGREFLISAVENEKTGWRIAQYIPMSVLNSIVMDGIQNFLLFFGTMTVLVVVLSILFSRQLIRPLERMIAAMRSTTQGHLEMIEIPQAETGADLKVILENYNSMAARINESIDTTYIYELNNKRMELKMLRYQINPHFMYNTLNTISSLGEIEGVESIVQTAQSLSKILYYNVKGKDIVRLQDEMEYIRNFQQIQDIRFPGRFTLVVDITPEAAQCRMLKFLIQPILENAISHGLADKRSGAVIKITGKVEGETLLLSVYDNGVGMNREALEKWNHRLSETVADDPAEQADDNGIGLINVSARIQNYYGPPCGLSVESEEHKFTRVTMRLGVIG